MAGRGRPKTGYNRPKTINFRPVEVEILTAWGLSRIPRMNFSDVVRMAIYRFAVAEGIDLNAAPAEKSDTKGDMS